MQTDPASCFLCEASCGIEVTHDGKRVESIRGDARDPLSRGYICPKASALIDLQADPDRLRRPLKKVNGEFVAVSWEQALSECADRLHAIQQRYGKDAVGMYAGNPTGHSYSAMLYGLLLEKVLHSRNSFSAHSVDGLPRLLTSYLVYGNQAVLPIPDIDRTDYWLILGANPVVSNGSIMTAPGAKRRIKAIQERGGRVVVVDPRRTETARIADEHHPIRPVADAYLLMSMLQVIFARRLESPARLPASGEDTVRRLVKGFAPARTAARVGIDADTIEQLAMDFARAPSAVAYGRMGASTQRFGTITTWLIDVLNYVTGNLDRAGGAMFPTPAVDLSLVAKQLRQLGSFDTFKSRVSGLPEFNGQLPVAAMAQEIETPGTGQVRAMITHAGNPVLSLPNGRRLDDAFASLELMISVDIYINETTRHADYILPPTFGLERDDYQLLFRALGVRNTARYSLPLLKPADGAKPDWEILGELASGLIARRGVAGRIAAAPLRSVLNRGPEGALAGFLRFGPHGTGLRRGGDGMSLQKLKDHPHGIDLGPLQPRLAELLDGQPLRLAPEELVIDVERLHADLEATSADQLLLIGRRQLRSNNSWMHNSRRLVKGRPRCTLLMHPDDAAARGLSANEFVVIRTRVGAIEAPVELTDDMARGVVSLPHGWGHDRDDIRMSVAAEHAGVSLNDVTDDTLIDKLSGCTHFNGVPVSVEALPVAAE